VGADQADARKIYRQTVRSVAWVRGTKSCTGWLFDRERKLLVSSARGVGKDDSLQICFPEFQDGKLIAEREYYENEAKPISGKVIARDTKRDLVVIQLEAVPDGVTALKLAGESVAAGDRLHAILNTTASPGLWGYSSGLVRQIYRKKEQLQGTPLDARIVLSQLPMNPGDNGGPIVNDAGELVAVAAAAVDKTRLVTIAIDVSEVRDFVAKIKVDKTQEEGEKGRMGEGENGRRAVNSFAAREFVALPPPHNTPCNESLAADFRSPSPLLPFSPSPLLLYPVAADFQQLLPATVWIVSSRAKENGCTGCLVDRKRGLVLTAARMVGDDETVKVWFPVFEDDKLVGERDHYRNKVDPIQARVLQREPRCGLALLLLDSVPESAAELKLAAASAEPGEDVQTIGNPVFTTGLWVFHQGVVRQVFRRKAKLKDADFDARVLQTQTPYNPGDAGGPVVNGKGELIGIVDGAVQGTQYVTQCIDVTEISSILKNAKKDKE